jgi:hypothetical protein
MKRACWIPLLLAVLLALPAPPAAAADGEAEKNPIARQAELALWWGDIDALEALYAHARQSTTENPWDGRTPRQSMDDGMNRAMDYPGLDAAYFRELDLLTARWLQQKPDSDLRHLLRAMALSHQAWHARGGGLADTVPKAAWSKFKAGIAEAEQVLGAEGPRLLADTRAHVLLLDLGRAAGWPRAQRLALAEDGLARATPDGPDILRALVTALVPKWGGDDQLRDVTRAIDDLIVRIEASRRDEAYAVVWAHVAVQTNTQQFSAARPDWPRVLRGYRQRADRLKDPMFRQRLGYLACLAGDRDIAREALQGVVQPIRKAWEGGGAGTQQNYETCMAWLNAAR